MAQTKPKRRSKDSRNVRKRSCQFCLDKVQVIDWKDTGVLRKYMSDRGKIKARRVNGNCEQHQKLLSRAIKNAREMAILPYINR